MGDDPASAVYIGGKQRASKEVGIEAFDHRVPATASEDEVAVLIERLNEDDAVSGILCQLPVPDHMDGLKLTRLISPAVAACIEALVRSDNGEVRRYIHNYATTTASHFRPNYPAT